MAILITGRYPVVARAEAGVAAALRLPVTAAIRVTAVRSFGTLIVCRKELRVCSVADARSSGLHRRRWRIDRQHFVKVFVTEAGSRLAVPNRRANDGVAVPALESGDVLRERDVPVSITELALPVGSPLRVLKAPPELFAFTVHAQPADRRPTEDVDHGAVVSGVTPTLHTSHLRSTPSGTRGKNRFTIKTECSVELNFSVAI